MLLDNTKNGFTLKSDFELRKAYFLFKILIIALESRNQIEITNSVKDVLKKCILTRGVKVDDLPTFDIEYIFLNLSLIHISEPTRPY